MAGKAVFKFLETAGGGLPEPYPLEQLFKVTNAEWGRILGTDMNMVRRLYFTSYLLVYYFMHLDGAGDGQLFVRYLRAVAASMKAKKGGEGVKNLAILMDGRSEEELMKQIRSAYVKLGVRL